MNTKTDTLLATAKAFYDRGAHIQYDQLSMDRIARVSPRRRMHAAPEEATRQRTLFLDCSSLVWAIYYNAFGYEMEGDVTWDMIDLATPRVYYREFAAPLTPQEVEWYTEEIRSLLLVGDVILYGAADNGHAMMYLGGERYINCTAAGKTGSYDYEARRDVHYETGGILIEDVKYLFEPCGDAILGRNYLFAETVRRVAVIRPLEQVGEPTAAARARIGSCKKLICGVESSHPGGRTAAPGEAVTYTVCVRNRSGQPVDARVEFSAAPGTRLQSPGWETLAVPHKMIKTAQFQVCVQDDAEGVLAPPAVNVNGLAVAAPRLLCGRNLPEADAERLVKDLKARLGGGGEATAAISAAYAELGIAVEADAARLLARLFYRHDAAVGDVFSRRPARGMAVDALFGGYGVITPQAPYTRDVRATQVTQADLQPGDIVLCCDDPHMRANYACLFTGSGLVGSFEAGGAPGRLKGAQADAFMESLFGRFCFVVLRPSLGGGTPGGQQ